MDDQTPLATSKLASEGLARKFGDWCRDVALDHQAGGQEIHDFMADPESANLFHQFINQRATEYQRTKPLLERRPRFTLDLGVWKSKKDMIAAVKDAGHQFSDWANQVIDNKNFLLLGKPEKYEFIETTVKELTGRDQLTTTELYATQKRLGFCVAPHESACAVRVAYTDQPMDEWRTILSEPVAVARGFLSVLSVARYSDGSFVYRFYASPVYVWDGFERLFVCRKSQ